MTGRRGKRHKELQDVLKKRGSTGNWKRKHLIALCYELALEDGMDMSVRLRDDDDDDVDDDDDEC